MHFFFMTYFRYDDIFYLKMKGDGSPLESGGGGQDQLRVLRQAGRQHPLQVRLDHLLNVPGHDIASLYVDIPCLCVQCFQ